MSIRKPRTLGRPTRPLADIDVVGSLDQIVDFMIARELREAVTLCPWCGAAASLTVRLFGPLNLAHAGCAACGAKAIEE